MQKKNIIINGLNVQFFQSESFDKKLPLVFLHGWGSRAEHFQKILEKCDNYVALDLPGFGGSEAPQSPWSLADYADFVEQFLKKMEIEKFIFAGHSFGGSIAIKYCAQKDNCQKLILIGSAGVRRKTAKKFFYFLTAKVLGVFFLIPGISKLKQKARQYFYKKIDSEDYLNSGVLAETYQKIISEDLTEELKKITIPTVLIWGADDKDTPIEDAKLMHEYIKNSQIFIIVNAGHYVFLDQEKEFSQIFFSQIK